LLNFLLNFSKGNKMLLEQIVILALLQGFTEFLPISSSAHLILVPHLTDWPDQGLAFDVAVHVGTLVAVISYFYKEVGQVARGSLGMVYRPLATANTPMAWYLFIGTIPVVVIAYFMQPIVETLFRNPLIIAAATIVFALVLWWSVLVGRQQRTLGELGFKDAIWIGLSQAVALIPGTSRSGITMTAGLFLGLNRDAAARFSFLLSIPVIALAGVKQTYDLLNSAGEVEWQALIFGAFLAAVSAWLAIHFFLSLIQKLGFMPFILYRLALGGLLLWWFLPQFPL
jgi:undecaprenyl-diphosphatase